MEIDPYTDESEYDPYKDCKPLTAQNIRYICAECKSDNVAKPMSLFAPFICRDCGHEWKS